MKHTDREKEMEKTENETQTDRQTVRRTESSNLKLLNCYGGITIERTMRKIVKLKKSSKFFLPGY